MTNQTINQIADVFKYIVITQKRINLRLIFYLGVVRHGHPHTQNC